MPNHKYTASRNFTIPRLAIGDLKRAVLSVSTAFSSPGDLSISVDEFLLDGSTVRKEDLTPDDLSAVIELKRILIVISSRLTSNNTMLGLYPELGQIHVWATSNDETVPVELIKRFSESLGLIRADELAPRECPGCFLSYRFDPVVEPLAHKLENFLTLIGVDVVTGAGYEPRPIVEKVRERLGSPGLDFVVLLISVNGESMWTRDEIMTASARNVPVIPIVEEGAKFEPGLLGDLEYIPFSKGHVEESFIKLLEALRFVRLVRERSNDTKL